VEQDDGLLVTISCRWIKLLQLLRSFI